MLDKNVTVDDDSQLFETPRKKDHGDTKTISQILLIYYWPQCKNNNTTKMTGQKLPPSRKEYILFQTDRKNAW